MEIDEVSDVNARKPLNHNPNNSAPWLKDLECIRQIEAQALRKLQRSKYSHDLKTFIDC